MAVATEQYRAMSPPSQRALGFAEAAAYIRAGERGAAVEPGDLPLELEDGGSVLVETDEPSCGPVTRGGKPDEAVTKAGKSLEQVLGQLGPTLRGIVTQLRETADWPDQVDDEFAVKLSTDANVIIARASGEANFRIALRWSQDQRG